MRGFGAAAGSKSGWGVTALSTGVKVEEHAPCESSAAPALSSGGPGCHLLLYHGEQGQTTSGARHSVLRGEGAAENEPWTQRETLCMNPFAQPEHQQGGLCSLSPSNPTNTNA